MYLSGVVCACRVLFKRYIACQKSRLLALAEELHHGGVLHGVSEPTYHERLEKQYYGTAVRLADQHGADDPVRIFSGLFRNETEKTDYSHDYVYDVL